MDFIGRIILLGFASVSKYTKSTLKISSETKSINAGTHFQVYNLFLFTIPYKNVNLETFTFIN
jgi:hypothetical protein